jgi:16S rRNA processing protein RimM
VTERPRYLAVGRVTRAHGIRGEVSVLPLTQVASRFEPGSRVFVGESDERPLVVQSSRPNRDRVLVVFRGTSDRDAAEELRGSYLFVPAEEAHALPEGEFWPHELVGAEVITDRGRPLGRLQEIIRTPANDVWSVRDESGAEVLVPALKSVVDDVDVRARRVVVHEVPGLTVP